jgi:hypothetical protein
MREVSLSLHLCTRPAAIPTAFVTPHPETVITTERRRAGIRFRIVPLSSEAILARRRGILFESSLIVAALGFVHNCRPARIARLTAIEYSAPKMRDSVPKIMNRSAFFIAPAPVS